MFSVIDPLGTPHSNSDSERNLAASIPDYGDPTSLVHLTLTQLFLRARALLLLLTPLLAVSYTPMHSNVYLTPPSSLLLHFFRA